MKIKPYVSVGPVSFDQTLEQVESVLGTGRKEISAEDLELHYPDLIVRFDARSNRVREITALPELRLELDGTPLPWDTDIYRVLGSKGGELVDVVGFAVSFELGIAVSGIQDDDMSQAAIHVFEQGGWDSFRDEARPFVA